MGIPQLLVFLILMVRILWTASQHKQLVLYRPNIFSECIFASVMGVLLLLGGFW